MKIGFLRWLFIESHAKWLLLILVFEYIVAVNISPTVLTDFPFLRAIVESLNFIPAINNFEQITGGSEAVMFYIALAFILLIPKSISIYYFLIKNPITGMATYVITPYTMTKPVRTSQMFKRMSQEENGAEVILEKPRSMFSRIVWSSLILLLTIGGIAALLHIGDNPDALLIQKNDAAIASGGVSMWYELSISNLTFCGLLIAVSAFIIKDYIRLFIAIGKWFLAIFK